MNRRNYLKTAGLGIMAQQILPAKALGSGRSPSSIRLGGPVFDPYEDPEAWISALKKRGYRAAYCPVKPSADEFLIKAYAVAARKNNILIAEVGAWSNPISPDPDQAQKAISKCIESLQLAELIEARCCVNISGSKNPEYWAGPHRDNMTEEVFDEVVEVTRKIIDEVKPKRTFFTLEAMPWSFPYSTASYLKLLRAIDRKAFGVHIDPVNMITSPQDYYKNGILIKGMFRELGPYVKSCHAKDITLREDNYIPQLDELRPGLGYLNYRVFLKELAKLEEVPLMMEHLKTDEEYQQAAQYIRSIGTELEIRL